MDSESALATRRSKRSTAGNRMAVALAEIAIEEPSVDADEDKDFIDVQDEEEVFDSDFQSTDEEEAQAETPEYEVHEEEARARKLARRRKFQSLESATHKPRISFRVNEEAISSRTLHLRTSRRVSLGPVVNVETGEVLHSQKRQSRRHSTMLNTQGLYTRLRDAEEKRISLPKRFKDAPSFTQDNLIARALDTEEGNINEHRNYLTQEALKREKVKVTRQTISGPILRWISKTEEHIVIPTTHDSTPVETTTKQQQKSQSPNANGSPSAQLTPVPASGSSLLKDLVTPANRNTPLQSQSPAIDEPLTQKVSCSYLVHEVDQQPSTPKPNWSQTMHAVFGDHVDWNEVKVYNTRNRPLARPVERCLISGLPAPYRDPRTGIPFANVGAYQVLSGLLKHHYIWDPILCCYTSSTLDWQDYPDTGELE